MHGERDVELVESEPAVEGEADLYNVSATEQAQVYLLLLRVRAVDVYAVAVVDEEAEDRVVNLALKSRAHAKRQSRARLDDSGGTARRVEKLGAHYLCAAVAVAVCVAQRRAPLVVFALFGRGFGPRRLVLVGLLALHDDLLVVVQNVRRRSVFDDATGAQEYRARAERAHRRRVVRDEEDCRAALLNLLDASEAAVLEDRVADGERLVNDEYVRLDVGGDGEGEADEHAARIRLDGLVYERADFGEAFDVWEESVGLAARESHQRGVHVDVLDARTFRVEARAEFQESGHAPVAPHAPFGRLKRARDDLQKG